MNILILLVGSNPLPSYIVGDYLMKKGRAEAKKALPEPGKIILVHSKDTEKFAKRVSNKLNIQPEPEYVDLNTDERNPCVIVKGIQGKLDELAKADVINTIHLNYTGGTKPMSLYGSIAVNEWIEKEKKKDKIKVILSDIDPNNHKIVLREKPDYPLDGDMLDVVKVKTDTVLDLHDMKTVHAGVQHLTIPIPEDRLMEFAYQAIIKYRNNQKQIFQIFSKIKIRGRSSQEKERSINRQIPQTDFQANFNQISTEFPSLGNFDFNQGKLPFIEFFTGKWLEDLVLNTLTKLKAATPIDEIAKGVEASYGNRKTEIDVIAIRGYKLFLFSCTTSQEIKWVKQKAFEALHRAEQLGGEHAKLIVVSLMHNRRVQGNSFTEDNNLDELKKDLAQFDAARNCRLTGIDDLQGECEGRGTFTQRLKSIIMGVE